jgi:hypothetical protein
MIVARGVGMIDSRKSAKQEFREDFADAMERVMNLVS